MILMKKLRRTLALLLTAAMVFSLSLAAFAAETDDLIANARKKLDKKNADMVVANDVTQPGAGFAGDTNRVTLVTRSDARELPLMSKRDVADAILDRALELMRP